MTSRRFDRECSTLSHRRARLLRRTAAPLLALACWTFSHARDLGAQVPADSLYVSIITMGPGAEVFDRFGHISIRVRNLRTGVDTAYNWGMYDFEQPHFIRRFLTGNTRYWMQGYPTVPFLSWYRDAGRAIREQELNLTPAEKDSLYRFIQWNVKDENKYYRYDYYRDNCSTRVRDAIDRVLHGSLRRALGTKEHGRSYRSETLRLAATFPVLNLGMDFVLGPRADSTISAWDEMFIPMRLRDLLNGVTVRHDDGTTGPLVRSERDLSGTVRFVEADRPPSYLLPSLGFGLALGALLVVLGCLAGASAGARWALGSLVAVWSVGAGASGLLLLYAGLFTRHVYMSRNPNVLLATPVALALAVMIPLALRRGRSLRLGRATAALALFAAVCAAVPLALRLVPALASQNLPLIALVLPVQAAIAVAARRLAGTGGAS